MSAEHTEPGSAQVTEVRLAIVGSGFSGLGMAIRLKQAGIDDFVVLERADDLGGTWRDNSYPGAACDVPSHLYSFSFAPNPDWSNAFSAQPEIQDYLRDCARRFGVLAHLRYGHEVQEARWDEDSRRWVIRTSAGAVVARMLVSACGPLSDPTIPALPGLENFQGRAFHSAHWDHDFDLAGKRVAVIGTGASAIQFVPQIQPAVASLSLFQRTAPWIIPRADREFTSTEKALFGMFPQLQRLLRAGIYWARELYVLGFAYQTSLLKAAERIARRHLHNQVPDAALRERLTPDFTIGCKRILISNDYYPALATPNTEVVTDGIHEIREHSIVTTDGVERETDAIIFGTGFHVTDLPVADRIIGREGETLAAAWKDGMQAHRGTAVSGFPNLFLIIGPNTGLGHTSMVFMIESQLTYILDALRTMDREGAETVEVRRSAQDAYNDRVQRRMKNTVWTVGGCASWYLDEQGRNSTLWPDFTWKFRHETRKFDAANYLATPARPN